MKKIKLALLILGISLFASCSGDMVENTAASNATMAKLNVIVLDAVTRESIDGVDVSLLSANKSVTNKDGIASFNDVRIGNHNLKIEKTGYASMSKKITIGGNTIKVNETEGEYEFTADETTTTILLYPENSSLYGYIFYTNTKGQTLPAEGAKVYAELSNTDFVKTLFEATTDANGKYSFDSLPANSGGRIWAVAPESGLDGIAFETLNIGTKYTAATGSVYADSYEFTQNNANFEASYNTTVAKNGNIVFTFTESINKSQVIINGYRPTVQVDQPASIKWESNKITITPLPEWNGDITVTFDELKSTSGKTFSTVVKEDHRSWTGRADLDWYPWTGATTCQELFNYFKNNNYNYLYWRVGSSYDCEFTYDDFNYVTRTSFDITITLEQKDLSGAAVTIVPIPVTKKFNYNNNNIDLRWNLVDGADYYKIYIQDDKESSYREFRDSYEIKGAELGFETIWGYDLNGRTISFLVQAVNNSSVSPLDPSKAVTVKDNTPPTLDAANSYPNDDYCFYFSEPINKETVKASPDVYVDVDNDYDYGEYYVCIYASGTYSISGIQDQAGNKYNTTGTATITIP